MAYPISKGRLVNFAAFELQADQEGIDLPGPWVGKASPEDVAKLFFGWEQEVLDLTKVLRIYPYFCQVLTDVGFCEGYTGSRGRAVVS